MSDLVALTVTISRDSYEFDPNPGKGKAAPVRRGDLIMFKADSSVPGPINVTLNPGPTDTPVKTLWIAEPHLNQFTLRPPPRGIMDPPLALPMTVTVKQRDLPKGVYSFEFPGYGPEGDTKQGEVEVQTDPGEEEQG
jgi:hypothetical protein